MFIPCEACVAHGLSEVPQEVFPACLFFSNKALLGLLPVGWELQSREGLIWYNIVWGDFTLLPAQPCRLSPAKKYSRHRREGVTLRSFRSRSWACALSMTLYFLNDLQGLRGRQNPRRVDESSAPPPWGALRSTRRYIQGTHSTKEPNEGTETHPGIAHLVSSTLPGLQRASPWSIFGYTPVASKRACPTVTLTLPTFELQRVLCVHGMVHEVRTHLVYSSLSMV